MDNMKGKLFASSLFSFRNLSVLAAAMFVATGLNEGLFIQETLPYADMAYGLAGLTYFGFVLQSTTSKVFQDKFMHKMKIKKIQDLNRNCVKLANDSRKNLPQSYLQRLKKVMADKNDIVESFFKGEQNYLKEKIVEQTLNLVFSYVKLLNNYCIRSRELAGVDVGVISNRLNINARKLSFTRDPYASEDLRKVIEMDEKIIERLKEEKKDLERISTKLEYMESTVNMFKHQIMSNIETAEMLDELETAVNEASALDSVLQERRKNRIKM